MKKIMFSDKYGLTQAVLDGRKTQTRRLVPKSLFCGNVDFTENPPCFEDSYGDWHTILETAYAYKLGEVVAVAQSYKDCGYDPDALDRSPKDYRIVRGTLGESKGWNNKMFVRADLMPHRIRITNVRVERLQDVSDEDCIKEGIYLHTDQYYSFPNSRMGYDSPCEAYASLIDKISGKGTWESNPFVFVYDFELIKQ